MKAVLSCTYSGQSQLPGKISASEPNSPDANGCPRQFILSSPGNEQILVLLVKVLDQISASGLADNDIPLEARIVAVDDIFDALTSERPYKQAWSNNQAFVELDCLSHFKLDPDCVAALLCSQEEIQIIQSSFTD